jgi:hypothetical protein
MRLSGNRPSGRTLLRSFKVRVLDRVLGAGQENVARRAAGWPGILRRECVFTIHTAEYQINNAASMYIYASFEKNGGSRFGNTFEEEGHGMVNGVFFAV